MEVNGQFYWWRYSSQYPSDRRLGGPQSRSGHCGGQKRSLLPEIEFWRSSLSLYWMSYSGSIISYMAPRICPVTCCSQVNAYGGKQAYFQIRSKCIKTSIKHTLLICMWFREMKNALILLPNLNINTEFPYFFYINICMQQVKRLRVLLSS
jgi:hypothetical protein